MQYAEIQTMEGPVVNSDRKERGVTLNCVSGLDNFCCPAKQNCENPVKRTSEKSLRQTLHEFTLRRSNLLQTEVT